MFRLPKSITRLGTNVTEAQGIIDSSSPWICPKLKGSRRSNARIFRAHSVKMMGRNGTKIDSTMRYSRRFVRWLRMAAWRFVERADFVILATWRKRQKVITFDLLADEKTGPWCSGTYWHKSQL